MLTVHNIKRLSRAAKMHPNAYGQVKIYVNVVQATAVNRVTELIVHHAQAININRPLETLTVLHVQEYLLEINLIQTREVHFVYALQATDTTALTKLVKSVREIKLSQHQGSFHALSVILDSTRLQPKEVQRTSRILLVRTHDAFFRTVLLQL